MPARPLLSTPCCIQRLAHVLLLSLLCVGSVWAQSSYVRVDPWIRTGHAPFRAYLMSTSPVGSATFKVLNSKGDIVHSGRVGAFLGNWSHSKKISYFVYAIEFSAPRSQYLHQISTSLPAANSPRFAVDAPDVLYSGLLLNTLFFYQSQRDGAHYIPNSLRSAPGHLKDKNAPRIRNPALDDNDFIKNLPPAPPLVAAKVPNIDASGGWWDAGDYEKYVETTSYTAALMQIGVRDFPIRWVSGARASILPRRPPRFLTPVTAGRERPSPPTSPVKRALASTGS